jgi:hypothetical protein
MSRRTGRRSRLGWKIHDHQNAYGHSASDIRNISVLDSPVAGSTQAGALHRGDIRSAFAVGSPAGPDTFELLSRIYSLDRSEFIERAMC